MSNIAIQNKFYRQPRSKAFGPGRLWIILLVGLFFSFSSEVVGQDPNYTHDAPNSIDLDYFTITVADVANTEAKINRLIISVDTNPAGERFVLTFGNGIKRVGENDELIDFIPNQNDRLSNAMDFAINSEGKFFVATNESNRRFIRVYSQEGLYLPNETLGDGSYGTGPNKFRGPIGLTFDNQDNLYVADHYTGSETPPSNPSFIKIYRKDALGNYKNNLIKEFDKIRGSLLNFPYRLAVNSQGHLYMAELGQNNSASIKVLQLDSSFNPTQIDEISGNQIGSPGSIIIDNLDNIFVADFGEDIDLSRVIEAMTDVDEFYEIFEIIKKGIADNAFNIDIYNPNNTYRSTISSQIDFPVDLAISNCGTLYVNNTIFDGQINEMCLTPWGPCFDVPNISIDFDLEAYQRSSGYDTEAPVIVSCPDDQEGNLTNGTFSLLDYRDLAEFSDNCDDDLEIVQDPPKDSSVAETTTVTITAVDDDGNISAACEFEVVIDDEEEPFEIDCPLTQEEIFDENCQFEVPDYTSEMAVEFPDAEFSQSPEPGTFISASTSVSISAVRGSQSASCSFQLNLEDLTAPVIDCPTPRTQTFDPVVGFEVPDYRNELVVLDNCTSEAELIQNIVQTPAAGVTIYESQPISFTVVDASENSDNCSFQLTLEEEPFEIDCPLTQEEIFDENCQFEVPDYTTEMAVEFPDAEFAQSPEPGTFISASTSVSISATKGSQSDSCSFQLNLEDLTAPVIDCPTPRTETFDPAVGFEVPDYREELVVSDNCTSEEELRQNIVQTPAAGVTIYGSQQISFTVNDDAGNSAYCSFQLTLEEEEEPLEIDCPTTQEEIFDENCQFEVPDYTTEMAVDFPDAEFSQSPEPGTFISASTSVSISATKGSQSDSCSFQLNLEDLTAPVIDCPTPRTETFDPAVGFEVPDYRDELVVSDNCTSEEELRQNIVQTPAAGVTIYEDQQISFTVNDDAGNYADCSFQLTLEEEEETPVAGCMDLTVYLDENGQAQITAEVLYNGDPVEDEVTLNIDRSSFTCADIGDHNVQLEIRASNGATVTCTAIVYVRDNSAPGTDCSNMPLLITNEEYTVPDFSTLFTSSDNCSENLSYSQVPEIGTILTENTIAIFSIEDETGLVRSCSFPITFVEEEPQPTIICASADEIPPVYLDENCNYEETDFSTYVSIQNSTSSTELTQTITRVDKILTVTNELTENGTVVDQCTFFVDLIDDTLPVINCPTSPIPLQANNDGNFVIPDYSGLVSDNCDANPEVIQEPLPGTVVTEDTPVRITATDDSDNEAVACEFLVKLEVEEPGNTAPEAQEDFYTTPVNETFTVSEDEGVLSNDSDEESGGLTSTLVTDVQNGSLDFNTDGSFTYIPNPDFIGNDEFTYVVNDGELDSNIATVRIEVTSIDFPNYVPFAVDDEDYFTPYETPLIINSPGVLENDTDGDEDALTAVLVEDVENGQLSLNLDGSFTYVPEAGFSGADYFTYVANDGQEDSSPATVTITVGNFNALEITCLPTQSGELDENCQFQVPDFRSLVDVSDDAAVLTQDPPVGQIVNSGGLVTLTATLGAEEVSCSFQLELEGDTTAPVASCVTEFQLRLSSDGTGSITAADIDMNSTDNCGEVSLSLDKTDFTTADIGENLVTLTVTDNSGNTETCSTVVTVAPNEDPNGDFSCRSRVEIQLDETGHAVLSANDLYTGDPEDRQFTLSQTDFSCEDIGENIVILNYTGSTGNNSCEIVVEVMDSQAPQVITKDITVHLNSEGRATITPQMVDNGSTDNCSFTLSLDKTIFSCKDLGENMLILTGTDENGNSTTATAVVTVTGDCQNPPIPVEGIDHIFIYPNPTPGPFKFATPAGVSIFRVEAFDARGRFILAKVYAENEMEYLMDLTGVEQAVYFLKIYSSDGEKILRVIIK